jgi:hypothetical protein
VGRARQASLESSPLTRSGSSSHPAGTVLTVTLRGDRVMNRGMTFAGRAAACLLVRGDEVVQ